MKSVYLEFAEAFLIFQKYSEDPKQDGVQAEHDTVFAGPDPAKTDPLDTARLLALRWHPAEKEECWKKYT